MEYSHGSSDWKTVENDIHEFKYVIDGNSMFIFNNDAMITLKFKERC